MDAGIKESSGEALRLFEDADANASARIILLAMETVADILIIEDDPSINEVVCAHLERRGYRCRQAFSGTEGLMLLREQRPDVVITDLMLPGVPGEEIVRAIRGTDSALPIIVISARITAADKISLLQAGADDYLTKPIKMKLLVSRVQAILKRIDAGKAPAPAEEGVAMDRERYTVTRDGREISLPRKEFALLDLLYSSPGKLFSREEIYARIWGSEVVVGDRTIDVHIRKLRQKIGDEKIVTVKGVGYKYEP